MRKGVVPEIGGKIEAERTELSLKIKNGPEKLVGKKFRFKSWR